MIPNDWNHRRAAPAPDIEAMRKIAPEAMCTMLCAVLTMKRPTSIGIHPGPVVVIPGTNPRTPTAKKTRPKSIPSVLAIVNLLLVEKVGLWQFALVADKRKSGISQRAFDKSV